MLQKMKAMSTEQSARVIIANSVIVTNVNYLGPSWSKLDHGHCARAGFPPLKIFKIWVTG